MKETNSETVAHDDGKTMKTLDVTATNDDNDNTLNWVKPTSQASEDDHTSCPQIYQQMNDAHITVHRQAFRCFSWNPGHEN